MYEEKIITDNLNLINYVIKKMKIYWKTEDEYQEYYDAGLLGLMRGAKQYNSTKGKESTFLVPCIRNEIIKEIKKKNYQKNCNIYGEDLSLEYEYTTSNGDNVCLKELIVDPNTNIEEEIEKKMQYEEILKAIEFINNKTDKICLKLKFGIVDGNCYTDKEISQHFGISHQLVNFRIKRAIKNVKKIIKNREYKTKILGGNMGKNLESLNNYLFDELERLNQDDILKDDEKLIKEINRSKAISSIASNIINNANVVLEVNKIFNKSNVVPELLGIPTKSDK